MNPKETAAGTGVGSDPLDEPTLRLKPAGDGSVHGSEAYQVDLPSMQAATAVGEQCDGSSSRGAGTQGSISTVTERRGPTAHASALPPGPEDFTSWASQDPRWTLAAHPGHRAVLAIEASAS